VPRGINADTYQAPAALLAIVTALLRSGGTVVETTQLLGKGGKSTPCMVHALLALQISVPLGSASPSTSTKSHSQAHILLVTFLYKGRLIIGPPRNKKGTIVACNCIIYYNNCIHAFLDFAMADYCSCVTIVLFCLKMPTI
jgi:hypothetical protein